MLIPCFIKAGAPFYESWTTEEASKVISSYIDEEALILISKYQTRMIGFLVAINGVPSNQSEFVEFLDSIKFIEEIGVISELRNKKVASEMVRKMLLGLNETDKYIGYRTNAMRYFELKGGESFESGVIRTQKEDAIKRNTGADIIIPKFSETEKQDFINKYISFIKECPEFDVSNSNHLFRDIFGTIDYSFKDGNYTFQKDPTGEGNDRIFPIIYLQKSLYLKK